MIKIENPIEDEVQEWIRVSSLTELDELVGTRVINETPAIWWTEKTTESRFDSLEEAVEAFADPYCRKFLPPDIEENSCLQEVKEFRRYSTDLADAWLVVQKVTGIADKPLRLQWEEDRGWVASFGRSPEIISAQAPVAICVAALRALGITVEIGELPDIETRF